VIFHTDPSGVLLLAGSDLMAKMGRDVALREPVWGRRIAAYPSRSGPYAGAGSWPSPPAPLAGSTANAVETTALLGGAQSGAGRFALDKTAYPNTGYNYV
jgi:hypothetical protein